MAHGITDDPIESCLGIDHLSLCQILLISRTVICPGAETLLMLKEAYVQAAPIHGAITRLIFPLSPIQKAMIFCLLSLA
jgi:hypothetical protein